MARETTAVHPYVGMWVTNDGQVRHELLPDGRYDEARGNRRRAYQGRYVITGNRIDYVDDTGFTADGEFREGVLYHAGMVLRRVTATAMHAPVPTATTEDTPVPTTEGPNAPDTTQPRALGEENAAIIGRLYDAVNGKDLEYIAALGAPASEWLDVPFDFTSTGTSAIVGPWKSWFDIFPDATCEVQRLVALGDHVVAQGIGRGTHRGVFRSPAGELQPTGRSMEVRFCDVYRLEGGKVIRADSYFDFYGLLRQLAPDHAAVRPA